MTGDPPNEEKRRPGQRGKGVAAQVRTAEALELRIQGLSYGAIAAKLGISRQAVAEALEGELLALADIRRRLAAVHLDLELERLDRLQNVYSATAEMGDVRSGEMVLRIMDRRAKYLGLDAKALGAATTETAAEERNAILQAWLAKKTPAPSMGEEDEEDPEE